MADWIIRTKIAAPSIGLRLMERKVSCRAEDVLGGALSIVAAPGGYGKTTTLVQWARRLAGAGVVTAWLSLDEYDVDPIVFLTYVAASIAEAGGPVPDGLVRLLDTESARPDALLAMLINALMDDGRKVVLFLDDLHLVPEGPVVALLHRLLQTAPANFHVVIASRERPAGLIGRRRLRADVLELSLEDLRLSGEEIADFLSQAGLERPTGEALAAFQSSTEGWIAGLKLAASSKSQRQGDVLGALHGRCVGVSEFFAHDVIGRQPEQVQEFLVKTAILSRFSADLATQVTGVADADAIIGRLEKSGLFIFSLDETREWFRYHHLFSEFLAIELRARYPDLERPLHLRASAWLRSHGLFEEAFHHALKADDAFEAASILDGFCTDILCEGRFASLQSMADKLPDHVRAQFPRLLLTRAWSHIIHWRFDLAYPLLTAAEDTIARRICAGTKADADLIELDWMLQHRKMLYARFQDRLHEVRTYCDQMLSSRAVNDPDVLGVIYDTLIHVDTDRFDFSRVDHLERRTTDYLEQRNRTYLKIWHKATMARARLLEGDTRTAILVCHEGLRFAEEIAPGGNDLSPIPGLILAEVHYERNEIEAARVMCDRYGAAAAKTGFPEQLISALLVRSRILRLDGAEAEARRLVEFGIREGQARGFERLRVWMACERLDDALRQGDLDAARGVCARIALPYDRSAILPRGNVDTLRERQAIMWVRLALAEGRVADARLVTQGWRDYAQRAGAGLSLIRWNIALAVAHLRDGDDRAAVRDLRRALRQACHGRYIRQFLDAGAPIDALLHRIVDACPDHPHAEIAFAREILGIDQPEAGRHVALHLREGDADGIQGALGARELELLQFVSSGLSNRGIGEVMGMTEGTVKWYLQQVYDKLGVRRRHLALDKARRLGLVA
jgi:LuxR family maltose regulon positive regulatory protein